jgi:uncharacterized protein DUF3805
MKEAIRLDEVTVFGGKLSFLIPHDWEEQESVADSFYLYSDPNAESGWFRVSLNTSRAVAEKPAESLKRIFDGRDNVRRDEQTGNVVCAFQRDTEEECVKLRLYYWLVANVVEPDLVREAVFSYTVLSEQTDAEETKNMLELLERTVSRANFLPETVGSSDASASSN